MNRDLLVQGEWWKRTAKAALGSILTIGTASGLGCLNRPVEPIEPLTTSTIVEQLTQSSVDKIDMLLAIDNSRSMADKQKLLEVAVPDLINGLFNPPCIDMNNNPLPAAEQPLSPYGANSTCPSGSKREFPPVLDIHVGIVTSSLGVDGANSCASAPNGDTCTVAPCSNGCAVGQTNYTEDDQAHLISRQDPCLGGTVATYQNTGFLQWDPAQTLMPPGDFDIPTFEMELTTLVTGLGQVGCGFESQNESWYRFLVDPSPYNTITVANDAQGAPSVVTSGIDQVLLTQREDFMRSDSLLAIVVLTDENDASMKEYGQYFYVGESPAPNSQSIFQLPRARAVCQTSPTDPCCLSCGQSAPASCGTDPTCANPTYSATEDPINLREWDSKRRFGIEFYYQPDRYVDGLTQTTVADDQGNIVPNPVFSTNPNNTAATVRDPSLVFLAEIVGVPWQDIARQDANGTPDLINGVDPLDATVHGGFKSYEELIVDDSHGKNFFDYDLGNYIDYSTSPATINYGIALNPLMNESVVPRVGTNVETGQPFGTTDPITGVAISPAPAMGTPGAAAGVAQANSINGHEWIATADIQYACIFDLPVADQRDCSTGAFPSCDCDVANNDDPLCAPNPNDMGNNTLQVRAKAYPGLKDLAILQGMQSQGIVASICPQQVTDNTQANYGYRPAVGAIIERLKKALGGQCLPRTLTPDASGQVSCLILEAQVVPAADAAACNECPTSKNGVSTAREPVPANNQPAIAAAEYPANPEGNKNWNCFCEITQTGGADLTACQTDTSDVVVNASGANVSGWCYVDATIVSPNMEEAVKITANCPETEKRLIRFVGAGNPVDGSTLFITCTGQ
jgi:hypothetical protein